jgi:hypothetical protein
MITPMRNITKSGIGFLRVMTYFKPSTPFANIITFGRHLNVIGNTNDAKLNLDNLATGVSTDSTHYH